jgi:hypothetical protein
MATRIPLKRFDIYALGTRLSTTVLVSEELAWWSNQEETLIGVVFRDFEDDDYGWVLLARDEIGRFRAIDVNSSYQTKRRAEADLRNRIDARSHSFEGIEAQGDVEHARVDLVTPIAALSKEQLHPYFLELINNPGRLPARRVISEIGLWLYPADPHFVREFQCHQFDQRLWEIYLWAVFREHMFDVAQHEAPDFECRGPAIHFTAEAVTIGPSTAGALAKHPNPQTPAEIAEFLKDYMPMKFGSALTSKLQKKTAKGEAYWDLPPAKDKPFIIALADFHKAADMQKQEAASMTYSQGGLYTYLYGRRVEWSMEEGGPKLRVAPVESFTYEGKTVPSGFFDLPEAENVSAVLFSNAGTISKFDRMGVQAGFGAPDHRYFRFGYRFDPDPNAFVGKQFFVEVGSDGYAEYWSDELQMFHNPNAKHPIEPGWFPGVAHHFFKNGQLQTIDYENRVLSSMTLILHVRDGEETADNVPDSINDTR